MWNQYHFQPGDGAQTMAPELTNSHWKAVKDAQIATRHCHPTPIAPALFASVLQQANAVSAGVAGALRG